MAITTLVDFKKYCLRKLGAPVVNIDITDEQMQDRYEDAIKKFQDYHYDGTERMYLKHQVTSTDITNEYIPCPDYITGIIRVLPFNTGHSMMQNPFSIQYQLRLNDIWDMGSTSVQYYVQLRQYTNMLDEILNGSPIFRFNKYLNYINIDTAWGTKLLEGDWVIVECFRSLDPETVTALFDNPWLKKYTTALFKQQYGANLSKYSGVQLIGGVVIDGQSIYDEASQEIEALEEELRNSYEEPLAFYVF